MYKGRLINLMMWLYDNHPEKITSDAKREMKKLDKKDEDEEKSSSSSSSSAKKNDSNSSQKNLRAYCKYRLENIVPARNGAAHRSPIKIEGGQAINYSIICDFMMLGRRIQVVDKDVTE